MVKNQAKRERKNKPTSKKYKFYTIEGDTLKRGKSCPRCGPGIFLAETSDRIYCGRCHYTEFTKAEAKPAPVEKKTEEVKKAPVENTSSDKEK